MPLQAPRSPVSRRTPTRPSEEIAMGVGTQNKPIRRSVAHIGNRPRKLKTDRGARREHAFRGQRFEHRFRSAVEHQEDHHFARDAASAVADMSMHRSRRSGARC